mmetsp:Transcript_3384/g.10586  ORF Transcript_3384/g.10586 Transcript_3384/m.10586 type:complete len:258 (+) Transcript_3384:851-1624(+)
MTFKPLHYRQRAAPPPPASRGCRASREFRRPETARRSSPAAPGAWRSSAIAPACRSPMPRRRNSSRCRTSASPPMTTHARAVTAPPCRGQPLRRRRHPPTPQAPHRRPRSAGRHQRSARARAALPTTQSRWRRHRRQPMRVRRARTSTTRPEAPRRARRRRGAARGSRTISPLRRRRPDASPDRPPDSRPPQTPPALPRAQARQRSRGPACTAAGPRHQTRGRRGTRAASPCASCRAARPRATPPAARARTGAPPPP